MNKPIGCQAFPQKEPRTCDEQGMTLRDYFAAKAMQGWLASYPADAKTSYAAHGAPIVAAFAYDMADAMIAERNKA